VDPVLIVAGALFVVWPFQYRWSMRKIRARIASRGGDAEHFERHMDRRWISVSLVVAPVFGVLLMVLGVVD
jgi:hypothetical protein